MNKLSLLLTLILLLAAPTIVLAEANCVGTVIRMANAAGQHDENKSKNVVNGLLRQHSEARQLRPMLDSNSTINNDRTIDRIAASSIGFYECDVAQSAYATSDSDLAMEQEGVMKPEGAEPTSSEAESPKPDGYECHNGSASFDCLKARTIIEQAICSNEPLTTKDCLLGYVFRYSLDRFSGQAKQALRSDEQHWIRERDKFCQNKPTGDLPDCLTVLTDERAKHLINTYAPDNRGVFSLNDFTEASSTSRNEAAAAPSPLAPLSTSLAPAPASTPASHIGSLLET